MDVCERALYGLFFICLCVYSRFCQDELVMVVTFDDFSFFIVLIFKCDISGIVSVSLVISTLGLFPFIGS